MTNKGRIVLLVSHGLGTINEMCSRCLWLDGGRLVMDGDAAAVTQAYQASVEQADELELSRKFGRGDAPRSRPGRGGLSGLHLSQANVVLGGTAAALRPINFTVEGNVLLPSDVKETTPADLVLRLVRVDGRVLWEDCLSRHSSVLPIEGAFRIDVAMDPFILGASLYRIDAVLEDRAGPIASLSRVFEVVDEEGQFGGQPLLFYPPITTSRRIEVVDG
jgi:lipopolysaccharide transport system ATP-binding protein